MFDDCVPFTALSERYIKGTLHDSLVSFSSPLDLMYQGKADRHLYYRSNLCAHGC